MNSQVEASAALALLEQPSTMLIRLRRPPFCTPNMILVLCDTAIFLLWPLIDTALHLGNPSNVHAVFIISCGIVAAMLLVRLCTRPKVSPSFALHDDYLVLPKGAYSKRTVVVKYGNIRSTIVIGTGRWRRLVLDIDKRLLIYPLRTFADTEAPDQLRREIRARLQQHSMGDTLIEEMDSGGSGSLDRNLPDLSGFLRFKLPEVVTAN